MENQEPEQRELPKEIQLFQNAIASPNTPKIYVNGFVTGQTPADVFVILQLNGIPSAVMNMSFTSAKSLAEDLGNLIKAIEASTNHNIMTIKEVRGK